MFMKAIKNKKRWLFIDELKSIYLYENLTRRSVKLEGLYEELLVSLQEENKEKKHLISV